MNDATHATRPDDGWTRQIVPARGKDRTRGSMRQTSDGEARDGDVEGDENDEWGWCDGAHRATDDDDDDDDDDDR